MAEARGGSFQFDGRRVTSIRRHELPLDEARLRPHLRQVQPSAFRPGHLDTLTSDSLGQLTKSKVFKPEPGDLRGIPIVGHGVGGCSPGTQPEAATINKLSRTNQAA